MKVVGVGQPPSAVRPARRVKVDEGQFSTSLFSITVKSRELWEAGRFVHLDRFISPRNVSEITGGPDALHNRIHTSVPVARTKYWRNLV